jgi:hypothetical protein
VCAESYSPASTSSAANWRTTAGPLIVASHDDVLLDRLGITRRIELSDDALANASPPNQT